jgi:hypothetical protein
MNDESKYDIIAGVCPNCSNLIRISVPIKVSEESLELTYKSSEVPYDLAKRID